MSRREFSYRFVCEESFTKVPEIWVGKRVKTAEGSQRVIKFIQTGILLIELEPEVLDWSEFQEFAQLIEIHARLRRNALTWYKDITVFTLFWARYKGQPWWGPATTLRSHSECRSSDNIEAPNPHTAVQSMLSLHEQKTVQKRVGAEAHLPQLASQQPWIPQSRCWMYAAYTCKTNTKRRQQKSGPKCQWTTATLIEALDAIENAGISIRGAGKWFIILASSLADHLYGRTTTLKQGLTAEEEEGIVQWLTQMQEIGHSVTISHLKLKVAELIQTRVTPFARGMPSGSWWRWFKQGHLGLSIRAAQGLDVARAKEWPLLIVRPIKTFLCSNQNHGYAIDHIWSLDKFGYATRRDRRSQVI